MGGNPVLDAEACRLERLLVLGQQSSSMGAPLRARGSRKARKLYG